TRYIPIINNVSSTKLKVIVGTKRDLTRTLPRQVTEEEGIELAKKLNPSLPPNIKIIPYFETSSKTGYKVDEMFEFVFQFFYPNGGSEPRPLNKEDCSLLLSNNANHIGKNKTFTCC
ncbi:uncharacterized protein LOC118193363, partial [Stegodyphus dumicola]